MVAFGKKLKERQIEEWQGYFFAYVFSVYGFVFVHAHGFDFWFRYYINYKLMKKRVKQYGQQIQLGTLDRRHVLKDFSRMLDNQVCSLC